MSLALSSTLRSFAGFVHHHGPAVFSHLTTRRPLTRGAWCSGVGVLIVLAVLILYCAPRRRIATPAPPRSRAERDGLCRRKNGSISCSVPFQMRDDAELQNIELAGVSQRVSESGSMRLCRLDVRFARKRTQLGDL
jgi:hypothetical protein